MKNINQNGIVKYSHTGCHIQGSTITFCIHWPGGAFFVGIHIYSDKNRYIAQ